MTDTDRTTALVKFTQALLTPLPNATLIDKHHNLLLRRTRHEMWRKARALTDYLDAMLRFEHAASFYAREIEGNDSKSIAIGRRTIRETVPDLRQAIADQILTPAPDVIAVKWKKIAAKKKYLPLSPARIAAAIAEDEAWLAAHPAPGGRRGPARGTKPG